MTRFVLAFFRLFAAPIRWLGADYDQFRAILQTKLTLDCRRPMGGMHRQSGRNPRNAFAWTLVMYACMGSMLAMIVGQAPTPLVGMTVIHTFVMTMVALSLIADFTTVLLDTTDNAVLQPRPVSGRTILIARTAHIVSYLTMLALSLSAATFIVGTFKFHLMFPLVFLGTLFCSVVFVVFVVQVFYLVAMRFTDAEKFRDIILYFQVGMTVIVFFGYQVVPRLLGQTQIMSFDLAGRWWVYFLPPTWFAAPADLLVGRVETTQIILTVLGIAVPLMCLILVVRVLAPGFSQALSRLDASPSGQTDTPQVLQARLPWFRRVSKWVCRTPPQQASFELVWQLAARDREFKQRTYPSFAFLVLIPVLWLFRGHGDSHVTMEGLSDTRGYLFALYFACMMSPMVSLQLSFSSRHEAAWIYRALPLQKPGDVLLAALEVALIRFVVPAFALISLLLLIVWGPSIIMDVLAAFSVTMLVSVLESMLLSRDLPFSKEYNVAQNAGHIGRTLLLMIIPAVFGGIHYLLVALSEWTLPAYASAVLLAAAVLMRHYAATDWGAILGETLE